ncbi:MAG TPA: FtsX-like permease family protein, partial [Bryobacteraceae bacterium]|nr:FtsX-like permease family protein [Bryobacteraceae bacterium]
TGGFDPIALDLRPDLRVLLFATAVALATGILFGLVPALRATAAGPAAALKSGSGIAPRMRSRLLPALVVSQVALSLVLLIGAGLFVRTFENLLARDPGFRSDGVLLVELDARHAGYNDAHLIDLYEDILNRFRQLPGVVSASISVNTPLNGGVWSDSVSLNGQATPESVHLNLVGPRYFETLGTPLVLGRDFGQADRAGAPATAIVNEAFVRKYLPEGSPLGHQLSVRVAAPTTAVIVGVVKSTVAFSLREQTPPFVYLPYFQYGNEITNATYEIHVAGSLARTSALVHEILRAKFSATPAQIREQALSEQVARTLVRERTLAALGTCFGVLALILAAVGLYGLLAYMVARATSEIGIRMALGARRGEVLALILKGALRLLAFGVALGVPVAWAATHWIGSMLFGLRATDPLTTALAAALLALTGLAAALVPALRAARVDPLVALHYE